MIGLRTGYNLFRKNILLFQPNEQYKAQVCNFLID